MFIAKMPQTVESHARRQTAIQFGFGFPRRPWRRRADLACQLNILGLVEFHPSGF
jgi:hypothetical protein